MADMHSGWAPPDRVRRSVVLPIGLDRQITTLAKEHQSTPSTVLVDVLRTAVGDFSFETAEAVLQAPSEPAERLVQHVVVIEPSVNEALDERVSKLRVAANSDRTGLDFSDLVTAIVRRYLDQPHRNGAASLNGAVPD